MLTDLKTEFAEWLIDPGRVGTQVEWADAHGVTPQTLSNWKKDPAFKSQLNKLLGQMNVDSLRIQAVVDAMWDKAAQGDVKAAELYLRYIEKLQPPRPIEDDTDVSKLSDEELLVALQEASSTLRGR